MLNSGYDAPMLAWLLSLLFVPAGFLYNDPAADQLIRQTMQSTYNLHLADAREGAKSLESRFPDHPVGYTLMAETYWWEAQMDPGNAGIENAYYAAQKLAAEKGEAALKLTKYPRTEVEAYLEYAYGSYAQFQVTQKGAYFSALRMGLRAHKYAEEVYALDNTYYDIYVGKGAFNYFTGSLPAMIKPFAFLIGARGNRDLGIDELKTAMSKARYAQTEARIIYYTAMREERNWPEAFRVLATLRSDYKDNFVLYTWVTDWHRMQEKNLAGADYFEKVFSEEIKRSPTMAKYALLEEVQLQDAERHRADALQTMARLKAIPGVDVLLAKKIQAMDKTLRKQLP